MPENEAPTTTITRLLDKNIQVVKEDSSLAKIIVNQAWYDRELFKNADAQVTVALERCEDQKISLSGTQRKQTTYMHVDVWTIDKPEQAIIGTAIRQKTCAEINRIIREKRNKPNETTYNYVGVGQATDTHKAYHTASNNEPTPTDSTWNEFSNTEYEKIWYSDDDRFSKSTDTNPQFALMLFRFKINSDQNVAKQIMLSFEGYGTAPSGNGVTIKTWNFTAAAWQNPATGNAGTDETITINLTSTLTDFINADSYVYLLARTTNQSDPTTPAVLHCDHAECVVTVWSITYCDIDSYRDQDLTNVKPFVWHTQFTVKAWLFETVPPT